MTPRDEDQHGEAEEVARAKPLCEPRAQRDEDRQRDMVGGQRELEDPRIGADVGGDRRQRRAITIASMFSMKSATESTVGISGDTGCARSRRGQ